VSLGRDGLTLLGDAGGDRVVIELHAVGGRGGSGSLGGAGRSSSATVTTSSSPGSSLTEAVYGVPGAGGAGGGSGAAGAGDVSYTNLDIDLAGGFLDMAAQLMLMKSKLLLPRTEVAEDAAAPEDAGVDPRAELVRRLLVFQKYKAAGEELGQRDILDRTVFTRRARAERPQAAEGPEGLADVSVFKLIEALDRALEHARPEKQHEIYTDRLSITDAIARVVEVLRLNRRATFEELLAGPTDAPHGRSAIIATFLAVLEMAKLRLIRIYQASIDEAGVPGSEILVEARDTLGEGTPAGAQEDYR
jgi:segregation and condensation protein A